MIQSRIVQITDPNVAQGSCRVWTSAEGDNPGGSIKDHMVLHHLQKLIHLGSLKKNDWVSEVSSGSTALSLAYYAKQFGLNCHLFVPDHLGLAKINQLRSYGATLHQHPANQCYQKHDDFLRINPGTFFFNQLWDELKQVHYEALGKLFLNAAGSVELIIGAVGTGHSLKGIAKVFPNALLVAAEPIPSESCLGGRNIESERYGDRDPCRIEDFHQRILVAKKKFYRGDLIETSQGQLSIGESFRMVLGALRQSDAFSAHKTILAVGAQNHFQISK